jgi:ribonuclease HI
MPAPKEPPEHRIMYFDGTLNLVGASAGVLLISPQVEHLKYVLQIHYKASNNGAKYEPLIHGLRIAVSLGIKRLLAFGDSKVVIEQVEKEWDYVKDTMDAYCSEIRKLKGHFEGIEFQRRTFQTGLSTSSSPDRRVHSRPMQALDQATGPG